VRGKYTNVQQIRVSQHVVRYQTPLSYTIVIHIYVFVCLITDLKVFIVV